MQKSTWVSCVLMLATMTVCLLSLPSHAQQTTQPPAQQEQETEQGTDTGDDTAGNPEEPADEQVGSDLPDIDNQPIQPGTGGPGRFIPSEQISQDLGVSFPVDI